MKVRYKCYKCGKTFETEDRIRTDICPHCMSFIDLSQAERCAAPAETAAKPQEKAAPERSEQLSAVRHVDTLSGARQRKPSDFSAASLGSKRQLSESKATGLKSERADKTVVSKLERADKTVVSKPARTDKLFSPNPAHVDQLSDLKPSRSDKPFAPNPAQSDDADTYDSLYAKAEKFMAVGAWGNAAELFRKSLKQRESWQAHFGLVRASTRELTDLSSFSAVQKDADTAFDGMTAADRHALGARYVPQLEEKRRQLSASLKALQGEDFPDPAQGNELVASARDGLQTSAGSRKQKNGVGAIVFGVIFLFVSFLVSVSLLINDTVAGIVFFIMGGIIGIVLIAVGVGLRSSEKRLRKQTDSAKELLDAARRTEREKIRAQIDAVDFLCGYLKY